MTDGPAHDLPLVSFVIPVLNDARRLRLCLETIACNHYPADRVEVVVVDNGSVDGSAAIAMNAGATVLERPGLRVGDLRNDGARAARGDILAFVDADHEIDPDWISSAVLALREPSVAAVGAPYHAPENGTWVQHAYDALRGRLPGRREVEWLGSGNLAVWQQAFDTHEGFDTTLETCEDVDLCRRLWQSGREVWYLPFMEGCHLGGASSRHRPLASLLDHHRSMWAYCRKHRSRGCPAAVPGALLAASPGA